MTSHIRVSEQSLLALKQIAKILYEDETYVILNYIISRREQQLISESDMVNKLNLPFSVVRKNLLMLEKHGILLQSEHKKHYEENDFSNNNNQNYQHTRFQPRKNKSMDWQLNNTFYNNLQTRYYNLKNKLNEKLNQRKEVIFECEKCHQIYSVEKASFFRNNECQICFSKLIEKGGEDVTELKKKCNELIKDLSQYFDNSIYQFVISATINSDNKYLYNSNNTVNNNFDVNFPVENNNIDPLGDPIVNDMLKDVKINEKKYKDFCDFVEYFNKHKY
jgi:hypothetical protein